MACRWRCSTGLLGQVAAGAIRTQSHTDTRALRRAAQIVLSRERVSSIEPAAVRPMNRIIDFGEMFHQLADRVSVNQPTLLRSRRKRARDHDLRARSRPQAPGLATTEGGLPFSSGAPAWAITNSGIIRTWPHVGNACRIVHRPMNGCLTLLLALFQLPAFPMDDGLPSTAPYATATAVETHATIRLTIQHQTGQQWLIRTTVGCGQLLQRNSGIIMAEIIEVSRHLHP